MDSQLPVEPISCNADELQPDADGRIPLFGNPDEPMPYAFRFRILPGDAGERPHHHAGFELGTVLEGAVWIAIGERLGREDAVRVGAGGSAGSGSCRRLRSAVIAVGHPGSSIGLHVRVLARQIDGLVLRPRRAVVRLIRLRELRWRWLGSRPFGGNVDPRLSSLGDLWLWRLLRDRHRGPPAVKSAQPVPIVSTTRDTQPSGGRVAWSWTPAKADPSTSLPDWQLLSARK